MFEEGGRVVVGVSGVPSCTRTNRHVSPFKTKKKKRGNLNINFPLPLSLPILSRSHNLPPYWFNFHIRIFRPPSFPLLNWWWCSTICRKLKELHFPVSDAGIEGSSDGIHQEQNFKPHTASLLSVLTWCWWCNRTVRRVRLRVRVRKNMKGV